MSISMLILKTVWCLLVSHHVLYATQTTITWLTHLIHSYSEKLQYKIKQTLVE